MPSLNMPMGGHCRVAFVFSVPLWRIICHKGYKRHEGHKDFTKKTIFQKWKHKNEKKNIYPATPTTEKSSHGIGSGHELCDAVPG